MHRHWSVHGPPAYIAIALRLGLARPQPRSPEDPEALGAFLASLSGGASPAR